MIDCTSSTSDFWCFILASGLFSNHVPFFILQGANDLIVGKVIFFAKLNLILDIIVLRENFVAPLVLKDLLFFFSNSYFQDLFLRRFCRFYH